MEIDGNKLLDTHLHFGMPTVSRRTFRDIMGREYLNTTESQLMQQVLEDLYRGDECELDFPFDMLLSIEYGEDIIKFGALPDFVIDYLVNTPYSVIQLDYQHALMAAKELFERRLLGLTV